jgi:hypothetical protein|tara:strand:- start:840 stop:1241 length:402 start_codon:yes stop_codon:yes gene_type:complete
MRYFIIFCILTFLVGFTTGKVIAQETDSDEIYWAAKPVQCGPVKKMFELMQEHGQKAGFGGLGRAHSENYEKSFNVFNFLAVNMEDKSWVMIEINSDKTLACVVGYGVGTEWNPSQLEKFTNPNTFDNPDVFK